MSGKDYKLLQFHFHTPSENRINGELHSLDVTSGLQCGCSHCILNASAFQRLLKTLFFPQPRLLRQSFRR